MDWSNAATSALPGVDAGGGALSEEGSGEKERSLKQLFGAWYPKYSKS